jgi:predicted nicotinamide N-methyase
VVPAAPFRNPALVDMLTTREVELPGRTVELVTPAVPEALLDAAVATGASTPYWIDVWPCAVRLAAYLDGQALAGTRVLEVGCGLGLPSLVAALGGAEVLATDVDPDPLACVERSAERLGLSVATRQADYRDPPADLLRRAFDLVLAADVLYEPECAPALSRLVPRVLAQGGALLVAVSWQDQEHELAERLRADGFVTTVEGPRPWLLQARSAA